MLLVKFETPNGTVVVRDGSAYPSQRSLLEYQGDHTEIARIQSAIESAYGLFGHRIGRATSPIDLLAAISSPKIQALNPTVEGAGEVGMYVLDLPANALS